ncbi:MAG: hypothetical protein WA864_03200 [Acetobacteraceae bacterium]
MPDPQWHLSETYKSLITLSVEALKLLALVNGGAAVAILAYLGSLTSHSAAVPLPHIRWALVCYGLGVFLTVMAFLTAYLTQLRLYGEELSRVSGGPFRQRHQILLAIGCSCAVSAALLFLVGCCLAALALGQ